MPLKWQQNSIKTETGKHLEDHEWVAIMRDLKIKHGRHQSTWKGQLSEFQFLHTAHKNLTSPGLLQNEESGNTINSHLQVNRETGIRTSGVSANAHTTRRPDAQ